MRINNLEEYKLEIENFDKNPEKFQAKKANSFKWNKKWDKVLEWDFHEDHVNWFIGGKLNITENCLDRHLASSGDQIAIKWIANNPKEKNIDISYNELYEKVCQFSNVLKNKGIKKGDLLLQKYCFYYYPSIAQKNLLSIPS